MTFAPDGGPAEHLDVLIVGAGLSGIGAACYLQAKCTDKTFAVLEARDSIGGTWDLFRYPGVRSDSDMFTLGYSFHPWPGAKAIADGPSILGYVRDTAREHGIERKVRFRHRVLRVEWSTVQARWTVEVERTDTGERRRLTCGFLMSCTGYYRYDEGYAAKFPGMERFPGRIVHPQHWPEDLDYAGKQVVVIGSGATAVTLVPAMAQRAALVTMLQRSPSYVLSLPARDPVADRLRRVLPAKVAYWLIRWKNVLLAMLIFQISRRQPQRMKALIRKGLKKRLPEGYDIDTHFSPRYNPWDQRLCLVPDGDLFAAIRRGRASIMTGDIDTFTETGVALSSGTELSADVIVTATGLNMLALGGMEIVVDGCQVDLGKTVSYRGVMFSGIPNLAAVTGYTNASWTLKCELICTYVCRLLRHMDSHGYRQVTPRWAEPELPTRPFLDLAAGYVHRSVNEFPRQGPTAPWRIYQNYLRDVWLFKYSSITDDALQFSGARAGVPQRPTEGVQPPTGPTPIVGRRRGLPGRPAPRRGRRVVGRRRAAR